MTLKLMAGFDMYPGAADANKFPIQGQGINGTHYANLFEEVRTPFATNSYGVTGLPEHKLGLGSALERNALVFRRSGSQSTALIMRTKDVFKAPNAGDIVSCAFTLKVLPGVNTAGYAFNVVTPATSTNGTIAGSTFLRVQASSDSTLQIIWMASALPVTTYPLLTPGREYHMETRIYRRAADPAGTITAQLYIDGELIITSPAFAASTGIETNGIKFFFGMPSTNANINIAMLIGDLLISEPGGTLFAAGIGPQLVLPSKVTNVTPGNWEKEGNASAVDTLNDNDDTTYYASPTDAGAMSAKVTAPMVNYPARATEIVIRASRDRDAGRTLSVDLLGSDGSSLAPTQPIATSNGYNNYLLPRLINGSEADLRAPTVRLTATTP